MIEIPERFNLTEFFLEHNLAGGRGAKTAIRFEGGSITYAQVSKAANQMANLLCSLGVHQEQRVLLMLPDIPEFATAWFGAVKMGAVVCAVNPDLSAEEVAYYLDYTRAKVVITVPSTAEIIRGVGAAAAHLRTVLVVGGPSGAPGEVELGPALRAQRTDAVTAPTHRDDPAVWLFTSGSTGFPKGAVHRQRDFAFNCLTYALPIVGYRESDVTVSVPRLAFGYALGSNLLFTFRAGGTVALFQEKPTPEKLCAVIRQEKATVLITVPTSINSVNAYPELKRQDFAQMRVCISAGEALPEELYSRWKERTGVEILDGIGSAEMFHIFITNRLGDVVLGSLGRVVEGYQARICDDEGQPVADGEIGTLWVKGGSRAIEYWHQADLSHTTFRGEWCVSQDKFTRDANGYFRFYGRGDDMLKVGGRWLSPLEVENCLLSHPAVLEAAVVGFKDSDGLEKPRAFVVLREGHAAGDELAEELKAYVKAKLSPHKYPRDVRFTGPLPRSDRGKVLKNQLRE